MCASMCISLIPKILPYVFLNAMKILKNLFLLFIKIIYPNPQLKFTFRGGIFFSELPPTL
ncbi:unnamed protein product [Meloidogyne enterolobii]|uniref:Uncharacterized protein n=1 Tax=Meloidogyne enterolobii TaxID=390850 RepID=A0ACB0Y599_MELEN